MRRTRAPRPKALELLADDPWLEIRQAVLVNPNCDPDRLLAACSTGTDNDPDAARRYAGHNPALPDDGLFTLLLRLAQLPRAAHPAEPPTPGPAFRHQPTGKGSTASVAGAVGVSAARDFLAWERALDLPNIEHALASGTVELPPTPVRIVAVCGALVAAVLSDPAGRGANER